MNDAHPADGNEGLLSALFRKLGTRGKRDDDVTGCFPVKLTAVYDNTTDGCSVSADELCC